MRCGLAITGVMTVAAVSIVAAAWPGIGPSAISAESFTVRSVSSQIDVGNLDTVPLFDVANVEPGDVLVACFRVRIDSGSHESDALRLYSSGLTDMEQARRVGIHISREDPVEGSDASPGVIDCDEIKGLLTRLTLRDGSVADYAASRFAYTIGDPLGSVGPGISTIAIRIALVFPDVVSDAEVRALATGWVIETH